jgi:hypothetical protein
VKGVPINHLSPVEKLRIEPITGPFDCGKEELNRFLEKLALANQRANSTQTYVTTRNLGVRS